MGKYVKFESYDYLVLDFGWNSWDIIVEFIERIYIVGRCIFFNVEDYIVVIREIVFLVVELNNKNTYVW